MTILKGLLFVMEHNSFLLNGGLFIYVHNHYNRHQLFCKYQNCVKYDLIPFNETPYYRSSHSNTAERRSLQTTVGGLDIVRMTKMRTYDEELGIFHNSA
jgi:hypothetical protein